MPEPIQFKIELSYEKKSDGRYYIGSKDVPGFRLIGSDLDALQRDLVPVVKDLMFHNKGITVESLRWVPTLEEVKAQLDKPQPKGMATYIATVKAAA
jgi:hypothetical protein